MIIENTEKDKKLKKCKDCGEDKLLDFFYVQKKYISIKGKGTSLHYMPYCKKCQYKRNKKSQTKNEELIIKTQEYQKGYNTAYRIVYNKINKEKVNEKARKYYHRNKEKLKAKSKEYYHKNKEILSEKSKERYSKKESSKVGGKN